MRPSIITNTSAGRPPPRVTLMFVSGPEDSKGNFDLITLVHVLDIFKLWSKNDKMLIWVSGYECLFLTHCKNIINK